MSQDLMYGAEVKALVRSAYRNLPPTTAAVAHKIYSDTELATIPRTAVDRALGVANHLRFAGIQPTETILDIGCGGRPGRRPSSQTLAARLIGRASKFSQGFGGRHLVSPA
jgi:hypothetical protein